MNIETLYTEDNEGNLSCWKCVFHVMYDNIVYQYGRIKKTPYYFDLVGTEFWETQVISWYNI